MKSLHKIRSSNLPDIILAQIWAIRRDYKQFIKLVVKMSEFDSARISGDSPIYCYNKGNEDYGYGPYNWKWERSRLTYWIEAGRPIDLTNVVIE